MAAVKVSNGILVQRCNSNAAHSMGDFKEILEQVHMMSPVNDDFLSILYREVARDDRPVQVSTSSIQDCHYQVVFGTVT